VDKQVVTYKDLGCIGYKVAWDYQESLLLENVQIKSAAGKSQVAISQPVLFDELSPTDVARNLIEKDATALYNSATQLANPLTSTRNYFLLCEHPPVYTIGKSGRMENLLINEEEMKMKGIEFFKTNRGGDITFHGPGQLVGYPILDLEKFYTDIGRYLRELEEVIIRTLAVYGIKGERSKGETGVWIDPHEPGRERKICAMGVRCSRWITMHGFALNVNTNLGYFENIIPCGIENKQVTSLEKELQRKIDIEELKENLLGNFGEVFNVTLMK
jgi:lipoyl(octanoyl) transferase